MFVLWSESMRATLPGAGEGRLRRGRLLRAASAVGAGLRGCEVIKVSPQRAAADHVRRKCLQRIVLTEPTRTRKLAAQGGDLARTRMTDKCLCEALTKHLQHVFREDPRTWDPQS
ncbi:unnamed protein product [Symbiodinium microadriaticum]|nr:unnamed protein product [Symbiodinium microadriaticum]